MSIREAMVKIHTTSLLFQAKGNLVAQKARTAQLLPLTNISILNTIVEETCAQANEAEPAEAMGLPRPLGFKPSAALIKQRADDLYANIFASVNRKLLADKAASDTAAEAARAAEPEEYLGAENRPFNWEEEL